MNSFTLCNNCGYKSDDICEYRMWLIQETNTYAIICTKKDCQQYIDDHPHLFIEVPWSRGGPGKFMLLCGDCKYRDGFRCTHPDLKDNGGQGLEVSFRETIFSQTIMCGSSGCSIPGPPAVECAGHERV